MRRLGSLLLLIAAAACATQPRATEGQPSSALLDQAKMIAYTPGLAIPEQEFTEMTPPGGLNPGESILGGTVLEGNLKLAVRVDYSAGHLTAGAFQVSRAKVRVVFPFTEHATVLKGKVILTDAAGQVHTYEEGESYLIKQGSVIIWDVPTPFMQKSFFNVVE